MLLPSGELLELGEGMGSTLSRAGAMPGLKLKTATDPDLNLLLKLVRRYFSHDGIPFNVSQTRQGLRELLRRRSLGRAWLLRYEGRVVGYAIVSFGFDLEFGARQATLTDLFLDEAYRGRGLGSRVMELIEAKCVGLRIHALELQVERDNREAQGLYRKRGFRRHDRIPMSKRFIGRCG